MGIAQVGEMSYQMKMEVDQVDGGDPERIKEALGDLLDRSGATVILLMDRAGYLLAHAGSSINLDPNIVATLSGNAFAATQFLTDLLQEPKFLSLHQQGSQRNVLWIPIGEENLLVIVFPTSVVLDHLKHYALHTAKTIAGLLG